jgi:hypothetical protein
MQSRCCLLPRGYGCTLSFTYVPAVVVLIVVAREVTAWPLLSVCGRLLGCNRVWGTLRGPCVIPALAVSPAAHCGIRCGLVPHPSALLCCDGLGPALCWHVGMQQGKHAARGGVRYVWYVRYGPQRPDSTACSGLVPCGGMLPACDMMPCWSLDCVSLLWAWVVLCCCRSWCYLHPLVCTRAGPEATRALQLCTACRRVGRAQLWPIFILC